MKNKQEQAQILSEALDRVDEQMLEQALHTDTPEKFRELPKKQLVHTRQNRPVTNFQRYIAAAACLVFAVGLAVLIGHFAKNLPFLFPNPTTPTHGPITQPTDTVPTTVPTTAPTEPTTAPTVPEWTTPAVPEQIPTLTVNCGTQSVVTSTTAFNWTYYEGEQVYQQNTDSVNPLSAHLICSIPQLDASGIATALNFSGSPDSRMVRCWPSELQGNEDAYAQYEIATVTNGQIQLKPGSYIYEVTAEWYFRPEGFGTVTYIFTATCNEIANQIDTSFRIAIGQHMGEALECLVDECLFDDQTKNWLQNSGLSGYETLQWNRPVVTIPQYTLTGDVNVLTSQNGTLEKIHVYLHRADDGIELHKANTSASELSELDEGAYYIVVRVRWQGRYIQQLETYEYRQSDYLFELIVPDRGEPKLEWSFDESSGTLTVFGLEQIPDYTEHTKTEQPWSAVRGQIQHLVISDEVRRIGSFAFYELENLQSVTLPAGLEEIGEYAFCDASNLAAIQLPSSLKLIDKGAFLRCRKLQKLVLPAAVDTVAHWSFAECYDLQEVTILGSPSTLNSAFSNCEALKIIRFCGDLPANAYYQLEPYSKVIYYYPLGNQTWNDTFFENQSYTILWAASENPAAESFQANAYSGPCGRFTRWSLSDGVLTISGSGQWTHVGWQDYCEQIQKVVIENGIPNIASEAFIGCVNLTEVSIADSVTHIGGNAFRGCTSLAAITLPKKVTTIEAYAFYECIALTQMVIPDGVTEIADYAFWGCAKLSQITFPKNLTKIGYGAFNGCTSLTELTFPATLTRLGDGAFSGCSALTKLYFNGNPPAVSNFTFRNVVATAYYPPDNGKWAESGMAYHGGQILEKPNVPVSDRCGDNLTWHYENGVLTISGSGAMYTYTNRDAAPWQELASEVKQIILPDGLTNISRRAFLDFREITEIVLPDSLTSIDGSAFSGCTGLRQITIGRNVHTIGEFAFQGCTGLTKVTIGAGLRTIDSLAFMDCHSLKEVYFLGDMPDLSWDPFAGLTLTIYYPADNPTWQEHYSSDSMASITWVAYEPTA